MPTTWMMIPRDGSQNAFAQLACQNQHATSFALVTGFISQVLLSGLNAELAVLSTQAESMPGRNGCQASKGA